MAASQLLIACSSYPLTKTEHIHNEEPRKSGKLQIAHRDFLEFTIDRAGLLVVRADISIYVGGGSGSLRDSYRPLLNSLQESQTPLLCLFESDA